MSSIFISIWQKGSYTFNNLLLFSHTVLALENTSQRLFIPQAWHLIVIVLLPLFAFSSQSYMTQQHASEPLIANATSSAMQNSIPVYTVIGDRVEHGWKSSDLVKSSNTTALILGEKEFFQFVSKFSASTLNSVSNPWPCGPSTGGNQIFLQSPWLFNLDKNIRKQLAPVVRRWIALSAG